MSIGIQTETVKLNASDCYFTNLKYLFLEQNKYLVNNQQK